jgi:hypothetical protein
MGRSDELKQLFGSLDEIGNVISHVNDLLASEAGEHFLAGATPFVPTSNYLIPYNKDGWMVHPIAFGFGCKRIWTLQVGAEKVESAFKNFNKIVNLTFEKYPPKVDSTRKIIVIQLGDLDETLTCLKNYRVLKNNTKKIDLEDALPYFTNGAEISDIEDCLYDISFQGSLNTFQVLRMQLPAALRRANEKGLRTFFREVDIFAVRRPEDIYETRSSYRLLLKNSKFVLAPRGVASNSIRFFEALSFGRIPILLADNVKLPLESVIDYGQFIVRVPEKHILRVGEYVENFISKNDLRNASQLAASNWQKHLSSHDAFLESYLKSIKNNT